MDPIMIEIGPLVIRWYGFLITAAIFIGYFLARRYVAAKGYDPDQFEEAVFWSVIAGVIGARLVYVLTSWGGFADNPISALYIWQGGLAFHGGMLGGLIPMVYFARKHGVPPYVYLDAALPGVALGIIGGRLGNLMNGSDTVGRLTDWAVGYTWPDWAAGFPGICTTTGKLAWGICSGEVVRGPVHLTQIYGVLIGLVLLGLVFYWWKQNRPPGWAFWNFVLWYSLLRSLVEEPFRLNPLWWPVYVNERAGIGFFTATQLASIPLIALALYMLWRMNRAGGEEARA